MEKQQYCSWCEGGGYFGDFQTGLYPMPCPNCAGMGLEGLIPQDIKDKVISLRNKAYSRISAQTQRLEIAGQILRAGVLSSIYALEGNTSKLRESRKLVDDLIKRLQNFPDDYIGAESEAIRETWEQAAILVSDKYKARVEQNKKRIVGKSLREIVAIELQSKHARRLGFGHPTWKIN